MKKSVIMFGLMSLVNTNLFSMEIHRAAQNKQVLLEKWRGKEDLVEKIINQSKRTGKSQSLTAGEKNELEATFLPAQEQVVLVGPGYETTEVDYTYFLQQIQCGKKNSPQITHKKRCVLQ